MKRRITSRASPSAKNANAYSKIIYSIKRQCKKELNEQFESKKKLNNNPSIQPEQLWQSWAVGSHLRSLVTVTDAGSRYIHA